MPDKGTCSREAGPDDPDDCSYLAHPLLGDDPLPKHLCRATAEASCASWLRDRWPIDPEPEVPFTDPEQLGAYGSPSPVVRLSIGYGLKVLADSPTDWPLRLEAGTGVVSFILRQWVEDSADGLIRTELEKSQPAWAEALALYQNDQSTPVPVLLAGLNLPPTPCTVAYFKRRAGGVKPEHAPELPTRGLLVTSYCISPYGLLPGQIPPNARRRAGEVFTVFDGSAIWATIDLYRDAAKAANAHKEFWKSSNLIDLSKHKRGSGESAGTLKADVQLYLADKLSIQQAKDNHWERYKNAHGGEPTNRRARDMVVYSAINKARKKL